MNQHRDPDWDQSELVLIPQRQSGPVPRHGDGVGQGSEAL